jgi:hypothetical protein
MVLACFPACAGDGIEAILRLARATTPQPELIISYSDIGTFHGGTAIEVRGDGKILRWDVKPFDVGVALQNEARMQPQEMQQLLGLLVDLELWKQEETNERHPIPDQSFRQLVVRQGTDRSFVSEDYNLMQSGRIGKIHGQLARAIPKGTHLCLIPKQAKPELSRAVPIIDCDGPG